MWALSQMLYFFFQVCPLCLCLVCVFCETMKALKMECETRHGFLSTQENKEKRPYTLNCATYSEGTDEKREVERQKLVMGSKDSCIPGFQLHCCANYLIPLK